MVGVSRFGARGVGPWLIAVASAACRAQNPAFVAEAPAADAAPPRPIDATVAPDVARPPDAPLDAPQVEPPDARPVAPDAPRDLLLPRDLPRDPAPPDVPPPPGAGCADRTREGFADTAQFPLIAACAAMWPTSWMRAPRTGKPCGNSLPQAWTCGSPADACAVGWHVCGNAPDGPDDFRTRVSQQACAQVAGRFAGALGDRSCTDCPDGSGGSGAVCCGTDCVDQGGDCIWPGATLWVGLVDGNVDRCSANTQLRQTANWGVLCCRD
jgi:hypothetical protein